VKLHPRRETVFVFGVAVVASLVIGIGLGGGLRQQPSVLKLVRSADADIKARAVVPARPKARSRTGSARRHAHRARHSAAKQAAAKRAAATRAAAKRAAAKRAAAKRAAAKRAAGRRLAERRKAAAARARASQRRHRSQSPQPTRVVRTRSVSPAPRAAPRPAAPTTPQAPVRTAPKAQPAPPVQFNQTGTNPSSDGGAVQFDESGSGTTPTG
jgi:hypothetical protein